MSKAGIFALLVLSQFGCNDDPLWQSSPTCPVAYTPGAGARSEQYRPLAYMPTGPVTIGVRCPNGGCAQPIAAANQYLARYQMRMVETPSGPLTLIMDRDINGPCRAQSAGIAGCANPGEAVIYMNYDFPGLFGATLLHEAGHTLGYGHQSAGLMHAHNANARQIPTGYLDQLRSQYAVSEGQQRNEVGIRQSAPDREPPQRGYDQPEITYGNQLPRGVTRTDCPECMGSQWTLHGDWRKSPMFQRGGLYEVQERPDGSVRHVGRGWQPFSKFPPTGGGQ